jgi:diguanylate cyclase (GGDEF)-like protein
MKISLFVIILILVILLSDSYRRITAISNEKKQLILSRETVADIAERVLNTRDPAGFYDYILESCLTLVPRARRGFILRFNSEGLLTVWSSAGCSKDETVRIVLKPEETLLHRATEGRLDRTVMNQSEISSPLQVNGDFIGMLCINGDQNDIFTDHDLYIADYMAKQINIFIKYQKLNDEILQLSKFDSLTGLMNRAVFERETAKLLNDPSKDTENLNFVLINLDGMKTVNSLLGSHIGNEVIQDFAGILKKYLGKNDFCGRYSGDEFAAVIQGNSIHVNQIFEEAGKEFIQNKKELGEKSFSPGFCFGKATFQEGGCNLEMLYTLAYRKLHEMKVSKKKRK